MKVIGHQVGCVSFEMILVLSSWVRVGTYGYGTKYGERFSYTSKNLHGYLHTTDMEKAMVWGCVGVTITDQR